MTLAVTLLTGQVHATGGRKRGLERVKKLITRNGIPSVITSPLESLQNGNWVKLICGASFEVLLQKPLSSPIVGLKT